MAQVPANYIKNTPVDYEAEIFSCMGSAYVISGYSCKPPTLGVWALLETFESPFVNNLPECSLFDFYRAMWMNEMGEQAVAEVAKWVQFDDRECFDSENPETYTRFDRVVYSWAGKQGWIKDPPEIEEILRIREFFSLSFNGYQMIPQIQNHSGAFIFGAENMGMTIAALGNALNASYREILWETPMSLIGHVAAQMIAMNNDKAHISRPKDPEDIKLQLKLANEREEKGQWHPWQIDDPIHYRPSYKQEKNNRNWETEYRKMVEDHKAKQENK